MDPAPHLISTAVLALVEGQWVSMPQEQNEEELALPLVLCPFPPLLPKAVRSVDPGVMREGELALPLAGCNIL